MAIPPPLPHLPVEPAFDRIVKKLGGCRVDSLFPGQIDWENADYYFRDAGVIAELKEVTTDLNDDAELRGRVGEILHRHAGRQGVPIVFGTASVRIDLLPDDCRREVMLPFKRKFEAHVKKAARQIKETKVRLNAPDAKGLLILVNEASTFLRPDIAFFFLHHILKDQHSSIDQVVFCSINMLVDAPGIADGARFWANCVVEGRNEIPADFMSRLYATFSLVIDEHTGIPGVTKYMDPEAGDPLVFIKRQHAGNPHFFIQPKHFYQNKAGFVYYCDSIRDGTATLYLVESWQNGKLIQALFEQKLIHATAEDYQLISDRVEIDRLRKMMQKLRKH